MISIIICSKYKSPLEGLVSNIADTIKVDYELIRIDNSENKSSRYSAYNLGAERSKYPYLCFIHEDVFFHKPNWGEKIIQHLQVPNVGICGLAGRDFVTKVPASWRQNMPSVNIIQSDKIGIKRTRRKFRPSNYEYTRRAVIVLDGVLLCMKKELMNTIHFDESIGGFHGYDFDICIQSALKGFDNYVMYDILLEHYSRGTPDATYYRKLILVFKKWNAQLPILGYNTKQKIRYSLRKVEMEGLSRLLRKLVRRGLTTDEISNEIAYFTSVAEKKKKKFRLITIRLEVYIMKFLNFPIYWTNRMKLR